jgi:hypothetical protein
MITWEDSGRLTDIRDSKTSYIRQNEKAGNKVRDVKKACRRRTEN